MFEPSAQFFFFRILSKILSFDLSLETEPVASVSPVSLEDGCQMIFVFS